MKSRDYFEAVIDGIKNVAANEKSGKEMDFYGAIEKAVEIIKKCAQSGNKLIFIGNGASAAISSHMATDFWKNAGIKALAFNDSALLTCISNDFGYQHVFEKPIDMFAEKGDILIAISSSGRSENILNGAKAAAARGCEILTMSGFGKDNPLRSTGGINFYVPLPSYGPVEVIHQAICHALVDMITDSQKGK